VLDLGLGGRALALIDMVKAIDPAAEIRDVAGEWKEGGKDRNDGRRYAEKGDGAVDRHEGALSIHCVRTGGPRAGRITQTVSGKRTGPNLLGSAGCNVGRGGSWCGFAEPVEAALAVPQQSGGRYGRVVTTGRDRCSTRGRPSRRR